MTFSRVIAGRRNYSLSAEDDAELVELDSRTGRRHQIVTDVVDRRVGRLQASSPNSSQVISEL